MNLLEHEGKSLFREYGIEVPVGVVISGKDEGYGEISFPKVMKAQVAVGNRKAHGGIVTVHSSEQYMEAKERMFRTAILGHLPSKLLVEEYIEARRELYISFSYNSVAPVFSFSSKGGSGIAEADVYPIDLLEGCGDVFIKKALVCSGVVASEALVHVIHSLWILFEKERLLLAEINPLFEKQDGSCVAGDAKIRRDPNVEKKEKKPLFLQGDIAVIASGGGASMLALDMLVGAGGKPANYIEYSGNPPASVVEKLTIEVLSQEGLRGCWVVGGIANFTDIYETLGGFVDGLLQIRPKVSYPIVIRRDGPRTEEAFKMVRERARVHALDITLFDSSLSIKKSADFLMSKLAKRIT